jgi:23S rRNA pseudouridine2605 synthase
MNHKIKKMDQRRPGRDNRGRPDDSGRKEQRSTGRPGPSRNPRPESSGREVQRSTGKPRPYGKPRQEPRSFRKPEKQTDLIRLNKYIANAGICSRREADKLILAGVVRVNGKTVTELGIKVSTGDKVQYEEQTISQEKNRYILLNKPKGYITTVDDPEKRKTVMNLVEGACKERIYPVGRLDRNTTGLLLFTNDGNITKKLTHPRYGIKKIYHIELDHSLSKADLEKIREGLELEDGFIKVDKIEYIENSKSKKELGLELHSGKNRIVRRIFERLEYKVVKLDRVFYAGLTKKNLPRGHWRHLDEREINLLKMISS